MKWDIRNSGEEGTWCEVGKSDLLVGKERIEMGQSTQVQEIISLNDRD